MNTTQKQIPISISLLTAIAAVFLKTSKRFLTVASGPVVVLALVTSAAGAIVVPTGLNPGDKYHLVFVTSTTRNATSTSIADYNAFVQSAADAAGIGNTEGVDWFAIAGTQTVAAKVNAVVGATTPVFLLNGTTKVVDGFADMWDKTIDFKIDRTEIGTTLANTLVFTGSADTGVIPPWGEEWLGDTVHNSVVVGNTGLKNSGWMDNNSSSLTATRPFYALSEELTVAAPPPIQILITTTSYDPNQDRLTLKWNSTSGATYTIENAQQFVGDGSGTSWDNLTTGIPSGGSTTTRVIDAPQPGTYYRIRKE